MDYIVVYSTLFGCVSYRHPEKGSPFIVTLCDYLKKHAAKYDLQTILKAVRNHMEKWSLKNDEEEKCPAQICPEESTLKRDVYFSVLGQ